MADYVKFGDRVRADPDARTAAAEDIAFVEQARKIPNRLIGAEDGYVTIIERWEPAKPGDYAPMVVFNPETRKMVAMTLVSRTRKPG